MGYLIDTWLDLPAAALFAALLAFYAATSALIWWTVFGPPLRARVATFTGVVAPFFGASALLFAVLTGFLANEIGERNRQAARAVATEADALGAVFALSVASASDMSAIRAAVHNYVESVLDDEWPGMVTRGPARRTSAMARELLQEIARPRHAELAGTAVHGALLAAMARSGTARSERLTISADHTNEIKWATILLLGVLTQIAIGLVHLERSRAHAAALAVFTAAAVTALGLIALQDQPFDGVLQVSPAPLQRLLATVAAAG